MTKDTEKNPGEGVLTFNFKPKRKLPIGRWSSTAIGTLSCTECLPGTSRTIERTWPPKGSDYPLRITPEDANGLAADSVYAAARIACKHVR